MRIALPFLSAAILAVAGCDSAKESLIESATGGNVKIDGQTVTIEGEDGKVTITGDEENGGSVVVEGKDGKKSTLSASDEGVRVEGEDGVAEIGTGKIPESFPLPIIDGFRAASSTTNETERGHNFHLLGATDKKPAEVGDFYAKALEKEGFKLRRTQHKMNGGGMVSLIGRKKGARANVTAMREGGKDETTVTIVWEAR